MGLEETRRWLAGAACAALVAGVAWHHGMRPVVLKTGDHLQALPVSSLSGERVDARTNGQAQIINIFASWCPPCRAEAPRIVALAKTAQTLGIAVIGVDQQEPASAVRSFASAFDIPYPLYVDRTNITHDRLGARVIPTTILVDASGVIRWERSGPLTDADMQSLRGTLAMVHT